MRHHLKQRLKSKLPLLTLLVFCYASNAYANNMNDTQEIVSALKDQKQVTMTLYNSNLALIKDVRTIQLNKGFNQIALREVSAKIRPETAILRAIEEPNSIHLIEQNFNFDLLTPTALLQKFVGKTLRVASINPETKEEKIEIATLLSAQQGSVMRIGDRIETGFPGRIIFDKIPDNLRDRPTLVVSLENKGKKDQLLELSYLTKGLQWKADYVAKLNETDTHINLTSWVTLTNQSGTSYPQAKIQLMAGDVNQLQDIKPLRHKAYMRNELASAELDEEQITEESLFEYHLYSLQRTTTLEDNQTKQVSLLSATQIPVNKEYVLSGQNYYYLNAYPNLGVDQNKNNQNKVSVFVEFKNKRSSRLGLPLPKGIVRVYKEDSNENTHFMGEDKIDHTPKNETVRLKLGKAFDITAKKTQTNYKKQKISGKYSHIITSDYEIVLKNAKETAVTVWVKEPIPHNWEITQENHPHEKTNSQVATWKINIPAEGKTLLSYQTKVRY